MHIYIYIYSKTVWLQTNVPRLKKENLCEDLRVGGPPGRALRVLGLLIECNVIQYNIV